MQHHPRVQLGDSGAINAQQIAAEFKDRFKSVRYRVRGANGK
jgi:hypothetical protein